MAQPTGYGRNKSNHVVSIYKTHMQIEECFRDNYSIRHGRGFDLN